jgi:CBS-domain-containing membrane protein
MTEDHGFDPKAPHTGDDDLPELELSDEDILDAMQHIPGFLDISTRDFREIYHYAHRHALERLFGRIRAGNLMRVGIEPLHPDTILQQAITTMARQGLKSLPVVDAGNRVVGILTESDFLHRLQADTFLELLLRLVEDIGSFRHRCHETPVSEAMCAAPVTIEENAGFFTIIKTFHSHDGRSMPVVDAGGHLRGLLLRKDFLDACHLEDLL